MSTDRIRGGAGILFALLALFLLKGGPGISESAAAPGCADDAACHAEVTEEGSVGPQGAFVSSHTATCAGSCPGSVNDCLPKSVRNADGTSTWQCDCSLNSSPGACSGIATVEDNGTVRSFHCEGSCDNGKTCRKVNYNVVTDSNCPMGYSLNRKCVCE